MGRQHHLERLALGRSAFAELTSAQVDDPQKAREDVHDLSKSPAYVQQYDNKGRPYNPAIEDSKRALRHAQNSVLELTGVVESKTKENKSIQESPLINHEAPLKCEGASGGGDSFLQHEVLHPAVTYLPAKLIWRIQAGVYAYSSPFFDILHHELLPLQRGSLKSAISLLTAGAPAQVVHFATANLLYNSADSLQDWLHPEGLKHYDHQQLQRAHRLLNAAIEVLYLGIDIALLPLSYHGWVRTLGIAPSAPLLPSWRSFLPYSPLSVHNIIWTPLAPHSPFRWVTSPASLMLLWAFVQRNAEDYLHNPPDLNTLGGHISYRLYSIRTSIMSWLGYDLRVMEKSAVSTGEYEYGHNSLEHNIYPSLDNADPEPSIIVATHPSTSPVILPVMFLSERIDSFLLRPVTFMLETAMLRAMTRSYLTSTLPKTALAIAAMNNPLYASNSGKLDSLQPWKVDLKKFGLGLALYATSEVGIFFALYGLTRWQGLRNDWTEEKRYGEDDEDDEDEQ